MKNDISIILFSFLCCVFCFQKTSAQVGIGNTKPRPGAILDIENNKGNSGILIPRVNIENLQTAAPISNPTESLLVFNTNTITGEGFYYWNGSNWNEVGSPENNTGIQFFTYDYCECIDWNWWTGDCDEWECPEPLWNDPAPLPNLLNPVVETRSGSYHNALDLDASNFSTSGLMPPSGETFVIKLVGYYEVKNTGTFTINSLSDDGVRLYIDDALIIDEWVDGGNVAGTGTVTLAKGKHKFVFWYYENTADQKFSFSWGSNPDGIPEDPMHANQFTLK